MGSATESVRQVLAKLGLNASDQEVKAYLRENHPSVPLGRVSLILRRLRERVVPARTTQPRSKPKKAERGDQRDLFG
jgi:hypothetical protein